MAGGRMCGIYLRLSQEDGEGQSESIQNQRRYLLGYCAEHGLVVDREYLDDGYSGVTFDRPGFRKLLRDVEQKQIGLLLTKDLSRLGRDYIGVGEYVEKVFPQYGVRYIAAADGIDTMHDAPGNDLMPIRAVYNDLYAREGSQKVRSVLHQQQLQGRYVGAHAPYGYRKSLADSHVLEPNPNTARVVRWIFQQAAQGESMQGIARSLTREGWLSPADYREHGAVPSGKSSRAWNATTIRYLLTNPVYRGNLAQGRTGSAGLKSGQRRILPPTAWIVVERTHPPLVSDALFESVQHRLRQTSLGTDRNLPVAVWPGLIYCARCGVRLTRQNGTKTVAGEAPVYLRCRNRRQYGAASGCTLPTLSEQTTLTAVETALQTLRDTAVCPETLLGRLNRKRMAAKPQAHLEWNRRQLALAYRERAAGRMSAEDFAAQAGQLREQQQACTEEQHWELCDVKRAVGRIFRLREERMVTKMIRRIEAKQDRTLVVSVTFANPDTTQEHEPPHQPPDWAVELIFAEDGPSLEDLLLELLSTMEP